MRILIASLVLLVGCSGASGGDLVAGGDTSPATPTGPAPSSPPNTSSSVPPPDAASTSSDAGELAQDAALDATGVDAADAAQAQDSAPAPDSGPAADAGPDSTPDHLGAVYCNVAGTVHIGCDGHAHGFDMTADIYTCLANHGTIGQCSPGETCTYQPLGEAIQVGVCE